MEMAVGLAYACNTNFAHLPEDHCIQFRKVTQDKATLLWSILWPLFQQLGLSVTERVYIFGFLTGVLQSSLLVRDLPAPRLLIPREPLQIISASEKHRFNVKQWRWLQALAAAFYNLLSPGSLEKGWSTRGR